MTFAPGATTIQPTGVLEAIDGGQMDIAGPIANQGTIAALGGGEIDVYRNITNSNGGVVNIGSNSEIILESGWCYWHHTIHGQPCDACLDIDITDQHTDHGLRHRNRRQF